MASVPSTGSEAMTIAGRYCGGSEEQIVSITRGRCSGSGGSGMMDFFSTSSGLSVAVCARDMARNSWSGTVDRLGVATARCTSPCLSSSDSPKSGSMLRSVVGLKSQMYRIYLTREK